MSATGACGKQGDSRNRICWGEGMETRCILKNAANPKVREQENRTDKSGRQWLAISVDTNALSILQQIVPSGKPHFPCPHLIEDAQGKNWLLRPVLRTGKGGGEDAIAKPPSKGREIEKSMFLASGSARKESTANVLDSTVLVGDSSSPRLRENLQDLPAQGALEKDAANLLEPAAIPKTFSFVPAKPSNSPFSEAKKALPDPRGNPGALRGKNSLLHRAGNPLVIQTEKPSLFGASPAGSKRPSSFAPQVAVTEAGAIAPASSKKKPVVGLGFTDSSNLEDDCSVNAAETYLVKPAWERLKTKASGKASSKAAGIGGGDKVAIVAEPLEAWKLWMRPFLAFISVVLVLAGSWQLAGGL